MSVRIPFTADVKGFEKGLAEMRSKYKGFGDFLKKNRKSLILGGGAAVFGALATGFKSAMSNANDLSNMAKEAKTNVEALQVALLLGEKEGASQEQVVAALKNLSSRAVDAANGAKTYQLALRRLNIEYKDFVNLPTERKLDMIAKGYMQTGEDAQAYRDILTLLGEDAGPKLIGVLQKLGEAGFDAMNAKMKESGKIIREDLVKSLKEAEDAAKDARQEMGKRFDKGLGIMAGIAGFGETEFVRESRSNLADTLTFGLFGFSDKHAKIVGEREDKKLRIKQLDKQLSKMSIDKPNNKSERQKQLEQIKKEEQAEAAKNDFISGIFSQGKKMASGMDKDKSKLQSSISGLKSSIASVPVSSLQSIGGGGNISNVGMSQVQILRSQENLLKQLVDNTKSLKGEGPIQDKGARAV